MLLNADRASGLVALQVAVQSLRAGDCETAIVGAIGASAELDRERFGEAGMLSPSLRTRFASAEADGFVPANGAVRRYVFLSPSPQVIQYIV